MPLNKLLLLRKFPYGLSPYVIDEPPWKPVHSSLHHDHARIPYLFGIGREFPLLARLEDADVCIDQIHLPMHGKLAVEGMAAGCAVAACDQQRLEPLPGVAIPADLLRPSAPSCVATACPTSLPGASEAQKHLPRYHLVTHLTCGAIRITIVFSSIYWGR
jgi:hypothetical protein